MRTDAIPVDLVLVPTARPCAVEAKGNEVEWKPTGEARKLEGQELEEAMRCLGETIGLAGFAVLPEVTLRKMFAQEKLTAILEEKHSLKALRSYAAAYGPLAPGTKVLLPALRKRCLELGYVATLLALILEGDALALAWLEAMLPVGDARYYVLQLNGDFQLEWKPCQKKPSGLYFARPGFFDDDAQAARYAKEQLRRILAQFLNDWRDLKLKPTTSGFEIRITHLLPYYLVGLLALEFHLCPCGCGRLVKEGRKYFEEACYRRVLNGRPYRKIASWLRTRKQRGKLGEDDYRRLVEKAREMLAEGRTEDEVRVKIKALLPEE